MQNGCVVCAWCIEAYRVQGWDGDGLWKGHLLNSVGVIFLAICKCLESGKWQWLFLSAENHKTGLVQGGGGKIIKALGIL